MGRRKKGAAQGVSLFPFLSILACVIGVLTLMITALALGQMDNEAVADLDVIEQAPKLVEEESKKAEQVKKDLDDIQRQIDQATRDSGNLQKQLAAKQAELKKLLAELAKAKNAKPNLVPVELLDPKQLEKEFADLQLQLKEKEDEIKKLLAQVAARKKPPEEAVVQVRPGGSGVDLDPVFVECAADSIVVYDGPKPNRILRKDVGSNAAFIAMLDGVSKKPKSSVIFLVRDDGLATFIAARSVASSRYARNGKLPVLGHGKIDLSQFKPK